MDRERLIAWNVELQTRAHTLMAGHDQIPALLGCADGDGPNGHEKH